VTTAQGIEMSFEVDQFRKSCLLNGLDDIGLTMQHAAEIKAFEQQYYESMPWLK
jgi:3-isopropylmalate/(R)-2-methylmalate dehydratase small subunit